MSTLPASPAEIRQLLLHSQQLAQQLRGKAGLLQVIRQLSYVQLDSVNVVQRAHHHILFNRVRGYQASWLDALLAKRQIFEYWSHAAAYLPIEDYRFSLHRKHQLQSGERHWFAPEHQLMQQVLARVRSEGPLKASDFATERSKSGSWWDWQPTKKALEQLFMQGDLMVLRRDNFQKVFDLTERVLPAGLDCRVPSDAQMAAHLIERFLQAQLLGTASQISYLRPGLKTAVRQQLNDAYEDGRLQRFVYLGQTYFAAPASWNWDLLKQAKPKRLLLLNPFDNVLIQRQRLQHWFDFDYQLEIYVPADKRQFGYYTLPILWGDRVVGLVDVKALRSERCLLLQHLQLDEAVLQQRGFANAFVKALLEYAAFNACDRLSLQKANAVTAAWFAKNIKPRSEAGLVAESITEADD